MKITVNIDPKYPAAAISLKWRMPGAPSADCPSSLYLLPSELTPTQYPHAVKDLSRVAVFYGDHFVLFYAPDNGRCVNGVYTSRADDIYCNTFKLLEVVRKLHAKRIPETVLDTDRFHSVHTESLLTVAQLAAHPNLRNRDELGATLRHFWQLLSKGGERSRTFQQLMRDLSHYVQCASVYARGDEFYFDGRRPGGCGFNGGILPHTFDNSYGIHT
jgi:hypothetical protein